MGLRPPHYPFILRERPPIDFFEIVSENYMDTQGRPLHMLTRVRENYPIVMHGVSLSIGSVDSLNREYLKKLKSLADRIEPAMISDHLCWTGAQGINTHDLLPLPFTQEAVDHVARRVSEVQEFLGRRILLENVSSYVGFKESEMSEWEFVRAVAEKADCGILLDVNNIYVNAFNFGFSAQQYISGIPVERVGQYHLAGHTDRGGYYFDTHDATVVEGVWELYRTAIKRFGRANTLIEWDAKFPEFSVLQDEVDHARRIQKEVHAVA